MRRNLYPFVSGRNQTKRQDSETGKGESRACVLGVRGREDNRTRGVLISYEQTLLELILTRAVLKNRLEQIFLETPCSSKKKKKKKKRNSFFAQQKQKEQIGSDTLHTLPFVNIHTSVCYYKSYSIKVTNIFRLGCYFRRTDVDQLISPI